MTNEKIHVTRIINGSVYGHSLIHCDEAGCSGDEFYYAGICYSDVEVGNVYEINSTGNVCGVCHQRAKNCECAL